eukprot:1354964-Amorphochlora_amoeboformis.AAC.2
MLPGSDSSEYIYRTKAKDDCQFSSRPREHGARQNIRLGGVRVQMEVLCGLGGVGAVEGSNLHGAAI